jgi:3-hydroxyisobutyrate dehydrogenase-like beta-hydroxyacid dehydrogenase
MSEHRVGVLHPGEMGISIAATALRSGREVIWASKGRSTATRDRAAQHGLTDVRTIERLANGATVIVSICPPHAAEQVAKEVASAGFDGLYVEANAIAPQRALRIAASLEGAGIAMIDGGVIGGPAWEAGRTCLYLSGARAEEAAACFEAGPLGTRVLSDEPGAASALKMCYAAYTKGTTALLCAVLATAERLGVREALSRQWATDAGGLEDEAPRRARTVTKKAWRFVGEMEEIAATFAAAGMPGGFHEAAAEVYRRLGRFKGSGSLPALEHVQAALMEGGPQEP